MTTLYVDVYFLVNFVVDILAAYFSSGILHLKTSNVRLIAIGAIGGGFALVDVLWSETLVSGILNYISFFTVACFLIAENCRLSRRIRFVITFFISQLLIGGGVYYGYSLLDKYFDKWTEDAALNGENRGALIFSLLILLLIGVFRIVLMVFGSTENKSNVRVKIEIEGKSIVAEALVDSGNLVKDPMNMFPVMFVKRELAEKIIPKCIIDLTDIDGLGGSYRKRIRLVPVTRNGITHVMIGLRADKVALLNDSGDDEVNVTVAIDKEKGSFGGYNVLVPSSIL